ncbi:MAG: hypothetical protein ACHP7N_04435 [Caulobacterales bacterium]
MRRALSLCALALALCACTPPSGRGLNSAALDEAIAGAIGDPTTCVLLADRASGKIVYRYGDQISCLRTVTACDAPGVMNAQGALALAARPGGRMTSCTTTPDGSQSVGWAAGRLPSGKRDLIYSAVMEGTRALPGQEMASRLADAFAAAGL